jgi:hypothetical protein
VIASSASIRLKYIISVLSKFNLQHFWIFLLVLSVLWVASVFVPLLYSVLSPTDDLRTVVLALEGRSVPPPRAVSLVQDAIDQGGQLERTIHVAHYAGASVALRNNESHTMSKTEDSYLAWFQKAPKTNTADRSPQQTDGAVQSYEIGSDEAPNFLLRAYGPPLLALIISAYLVFIKRS